MELERVSGWVQDPRRIRDMFAHIGTLKAKKENQLVANCGRRGCCGEGSPLATVPAIEGAHYGNSHKNYGKLAKIFANLVKK